MRCCLEVSENGGTKHDDKKVYTMFLIKVTPDSKYLLNWAENLRHKRIGKSWSQPIRASYPTGSVAPIGSIRMDTAPQRKQNPANSGRPAHLDAWHLMAVSSLQEQDDCAMEREPCHSGEPSRMGWSRQRGDLQVKVNGALASTFLRGELTCVWQTPQCMVFITYIHICNAHIYIHLGNQSSVSIVKANCAPLLIIN